MTSDEKAIRDLVVRWHSATAADDVDTVLSLMADDVIFLVVGHAPMRGRSAFGTELRKLLTTHRVESTGEVQEVAISGNLAYCWTQLTVSIVPIRRQCCHPRRKRLLHSSQAAKWIMGGRARCQHVASGGMT